MSKDIEIAVEMDRWDDVDVVEAPDVSDVYADYISADNYD